MQLDVGQWVVVILCSLLILGYIRGFYLNRRKAEQVTNWLKSGLQLWGQITPGAPLGALATGGRWMIYQPPAPFQRVEAIFLLEPQENLLFWLFYRLQGRRDELILKISLKKAPSSRVEIRHARRGISRRSGLIPPESIAAAGFEITPPDANLPTLGLQHFLSQYRTAIWQIIRQGEKPHIILRAWLPALLSYPPEEFFAAVHASLK